MRCWFGVGASKRLYGDEQIAHYNEQFGNPLFVVAISLQAIDEAVKNEKALRNPGLWKLTPEEFVASIPGLKEKWGRKETERAEHLRSLGYDVQTATEIARTPEFQKILGELRKAYREREAVKEAIDRATSELFPKGKLYKRFGIGIHEFVFRVLSEYTLNEIAHTIHFARQDFVKAGHSGEQRYDRATRRILRYRGVRRGLGVKPRQLRFRRLA